jgi:hypothetical protein
MAYPPDPSTSRKNRFLKQSIENAPESALAYKAVNIAGADYTSEYPFKGINAPAAGLITVTGLDGVDATITVAAGFNPSGGIAVKTAGSTVTAFILCF